MFAWRSADIGSYAQLHCMVSAHSSHPCVCAQLLMTDMVQSQGFDLVIPGHPWSVHTSVSFEHDVLLHFSQQSIGNCNNCACALRNCSDLTSIRLILKVELTRINPSFRLVGSLVSCVVLCCQNVHTGTLIWAWEFRTDRTTPPMSASTYYL